MSNVVINPFVFGAAAAFVPSDISGLLVAMDADFSNFTLTGSLVDQMDGAFGTSRDFVGAGAARPDLTTVGGLEVVSFDGDDEVLTWSGSAFDLTSWTLIPVMAHKSLSSTGNTWFSCTGGSGLDQQIGIRGRYEGNASSPDWGIRAVFDGANDLAFSQDMGQAVGTTPVWAIIAASGGNASLTNNNTTPTEVTDTYSDDPDDVTNMAIGSRLNGTSADFSFADINLRALLLYDSDITGDSLFSDLLTWLDDKIV